MVGIAKGQGLCQIQHSSAESKPPTPSLPLSLQSGGSLWESEDLQDVLAYRNLMASKSLTQSLCDVRNRHRELWILLQKHIFHFNTRFSILIAQLL
jgi:hypothetical protein